MCRNPRRNPPTPRPSTHSSPRELDELVGARLGPLLKERCDNFLALCGRYKRELLRGTYLGVPCMAVCLRHNRFSHAVRCYCSPLAVRCDCSLVFYCNAPLAVGRGWAGERGGGVGREGRGSKEEEEGVVGNGEKGGQIGNGEEG